MSIFKLPDLGEGLPDAQIQRWYIKEGDTVKVDQMIAAMETAKAVVDVPSPYAGVVKKLFGKEGDTILTGEPLIEFVSDQVEKASKAPATEDDLSTVVGNLKSTGELYSEPGIDTNIVKNREAQGKALPKVRILAKQLKVDLAQVKATGPNGQITEDDVRRAHAGESSPATASADYEVLKPARRAMVLAMVKSHTEIVPTSIFEDAHLGNWPKGTDISFRIISALIAACKAEPAVNAWYEGSNMSRKLCREINLGLALDTGEALYVPVIKDVANKDAATIRSEINRYKELAQKREIPSADLKDATITLSNFGTFAGRYATPVIVPPCVAILGTGKIREGVIAKEGQAVIGRVLPLSLTFDHRAVTGGEATRFMAALIKELEV